MGPLFSQLALVLAVVAGSPPEYWYRMVDCGDLPGGRWGPQRVYGIDDQNRIVGEANLVGVGRKTFLWSPEDGYTIVEPNEPYQVCYAGDVEEGRVCGYFRDSEGYNIAYRWSKGKGFEKLPPLPGYLGSRGAGINRLGDVVGFSFSATENQAVVWKADGTLVDLGGYPGLPYSRGTAINDNGQAVGELVGDNFQDWAFFYDPGKGMQLTKPPGAFRQPYPRSLNSQGDSTGFIVVGLAVYAYLREPSDAWTPIRINSTGISIDDRQVVTGLYDDSPTSTTGFLWSKRSGLVRIADKVKGWDERAILDLPLINRRGTIVITWLPAGSDTARSALLVPLPKRSAGQFLP
ncbi:MAG: hypothetical protein KF733_03245 [Fimbriimonadaceae bacterium]|nr:MAG: hypothetical protein KF733_03245 [Fimbriimonadaceae bacterium]